MEGYCESKQMLAGVEIIRPSNVNFKSKSTKKNKQDSHI